LLEGVAGDQPMSARFVELRSAFGSLVAAALPGQAASQHLWWKRDRQLAHNPSFSGHTPLSHADQRLSTTSLLRYMVSSKAIQAANDHNGQNTRMVKMEGNGWREARLTPPPRRVSSDEPRQ
jgi:hypothetical protein